MLAFPRAAPTVNNGILRRRSVWLDRALAELEGRGERAEGRGRTDKSQHGSEMTPAPPWRPVSRVPSHGAIGRAAPGGWVAAGGRPPRAAMRITTRRSQSGSWGKCSVSLPLPLGGTPGSTLTMARRQGSRGPQQWTRAHPCAAPSSIVCPLPPSLPLSLSLSPVPPLSSCCRRPSPIRSRLTGPSQFPDSPLQLVGICFHAPPPPPPRPEPPPCYCWHGASSGPICWLH